MLGIAVTARIGCRSSLPKSFNGFQKTSAPCRIDPSADAMAAMYKIGSDNISEQQELLLQRAGVCVVERRWNDLRGILDQVASDNDLRLGKEEVHPDWRDLICNYRDAWGLATSKNIKDRILTLLSVFEKPGHNLGAFDPSKLSIAFLLGAGASKPNPSNIPTVKELLDHLLERAERLDRPDLNALVSYCKAANIVNIEDLLTATQLYGLGPRDVTDTDLNKRPPSPQRERIALSAVAFLQDTLQVLFGLLSNMMLPAKPNAAHSSIAKYAATRGGCIIVTTNYDCCIDLALAEAIDEFDYSIEFKNGSVSSAPPKTKLLKLHGSLNWYYCETCQEIHLRDARTIVNGFLNDDAPYSVIAICRACGGQQRALLVPPLSMKFDIAAPLTPLLDKAYSAFHDADMIIAVGFSFADADRHISRLISKSMQVNKDQLLVVFDIDGEVASRVRKRLESSIPKGVSGCKEADNV